MIKKNDQDNYHSFRYEQIIYIHRFMPDINIPYYGTAE